MTVPCRLSKLSPGDYRIEGTRLGIGRLWIAGGDWGIYVPAERLAIGTEWCKRNPEIFQLYFPRLRDARAYLDAVLASDPLPKELLSRAPLGPPVWIRPVRAGEHLACCEGSDGQTWYGELVRREIQGFGRGWTMYDRQGGAFGTYRSLREAKERAGEDMTRWASVADWSGSSLGEK